MNLQKIILIFLLSIISSSLYSFDNYSSGKTKTLYNSLDPKSISQHIAFYELYPLSSEGQKALQHVWILLTGNQNPSEAYKNLSDPSLSSAINALVSLVNKQSTETLTPLQDHELDLIEDISRKLPNRQLKGHYAQSEAEVLKFSTDDIDLSRGLLLSQFGNTADSMKQIRTYEALLDIMAMQILSRLPPNASAPVKIRIMNDFIFGEMGFRFPPHSAYAKDIDIYTFLPSVLDCRRGVCLGVSILYICLAQRLNLPLEMVTPPGHIYVRYREGDKVINIETTARGVHIDSEEYLSISTRSLQERTVKEVIGLAYFNQASTFLTNEKFGDALSCYEKGKPYLPNDKQLIELMAFQYLFTGKSEEGIKLLKLVEDYIPDHSVTGDSMAADFLCGEADIDSIKAIFRHVDETRESILEKRNALQQVLIKYPRFRAGIFNLAVTWLQLHRCREALKILEQYHQLEPNDPSAEYYLTMLYLERFDFNNAWKHLRNTEKIVNQRNHYPKALKDLRRELASISPE